MPSTLTLPCVAAVGVALLLPACTPGPPTAAEPAAVAHPDLSGVWMAFAVENPSRHRTYCSSKERATAACSVAGKLDIVAPAVGTPSSEIQTGRGSIFCSGIRKTSEVALAADVSSKVPIRP